MKKQWHLTLKIRHTKLDKEVTHEDVVQGISVTQALKQLELTGKQICDLKLYGATHWFDENGASLSLTMTQQQ